MKCLFFDVDGTLVPFGQPVPRDTIEALAQAKANGSRLFLSTGRSPAEVDPRLSEIPFDGGVYSGGARAFVDGRDIYASYIPADDLAFYIDESSRHGWRILLQTDGQSYYTGDFHDMLMELFHRHVGTDIVIRNLTQLDTLPVLDNVTKLILLTPDGDMDRAHEVFDSRFDVLNNTVGVPSCLMAEICQKGVDKGHAMLEVMKHLGLPVSEAMAFGDGSNDHEIIQMAGIGVAMGNAEEALKAKADYVTAECDKGGIAQALRHFGVI